MIKKTSRTFSSTGKNAEIDRSDDMTGIRTPVPPPVCVSL